MHKIGGAHLQYVNNHLAKFEWTGIKTFGVTDNTNLVPLKCCGRPNVLSSTPLKNEKKIMKCAQNRRCTSSICEQSFGKVWMKRNKNFWSYRLHKLGTPKVLRTAKCLSSTPLKSEKKIMKRAQNRRCTSSICEQSFGKVWMKRNKNFWSYRLHKLGTPKVLRTDGRTDRRTDERTDRQTDGRSGPITRPAFAKATQVKNW